MRRTLPVAFLLLLLPLIGLAAAPNVCAREIVDMAGRRVTVPDKPMQVYTPSPPGGVLLYALNPDALGAFLGAFGGDWDGPREPRMETIPYVGVNNYFGSLASPETLLKVNPDLHILFVHHPGKYGINVKEKQAVENVRRFSIPYVYAYANDLRDYPPACEFLGEVMGVPGRGRAIAEYIRATLAKAAEIVAKAPQNQRPKVYYAGGADGLTTVKMDTAHGIYFQLAGEVGMTDFDPSMAKPDVSFHVNVTFEHVLAYNPDVILVMEPAFRDKIYHDPKWQKIRAVQNQRVLFIPRGPFNWMDRPPSLMGALGLKWLLAELYPELYPDDVAAEAVAFYHDFLWSEITYDEMQARLKACRVLK